MLLRIHNTKPARPQNLPSGVGSTSPPKPETYSTRLAKLIPIEAITAYGLGTSQLHLDATKKAVLHESSLYYLAAICILVSALVRWKQTQDENGKNPQIIGIIISIISFVLFVSTQKGTYGIDIWEWTRNTDVPGLLALSWIFIVPILYKGTTSKPT